MDVIRGKVEAVVRVESQSTKMRIGLCRSSSGMFGFTSFLIQQAKPDGLRT